MVEWAQYTYTSFNSLIMKQNVARSKYNDSFQLVDAHRPGGRGARGVQDVHLRGARARRGAGRSRGAEVRAGQLHHAQRLRQGCV